MEIFFSRKRVTLALVAIWIAGGALHAWNIRYPAHPVFDEYHFATYATYYAHHKPHFDIHPPLGKIIYGAVLTALGTPSLEDGEFLRFRRSDSGDHVEFDILKPDYEGYPYIELRAVAALFGSLMSLLMFWFLRVLGVSRFGSLVGALLVLFENALLAHTRLILLDGMYLTFGLLALIAFFSRPAKPIGAGVLLGLALSVKLIAVAFVGPLAAAALLPRWHAKKRRVAGTFFVALVVYALVLFSNNLFFSAEGRLEFFRSLLPETEQSVGHTGAQRPLSSIVAVSAIESLLTLHGYLYTDAPERLVGESEGGGVRGTLARWFSPRVPSPASLLLYSPWYFWPLMQLPVTYFANEHLGRAIVLIGNPVVWYASTLAVIVGFVVAFRYLRIFMRRDNEDADPLFILLAGYITSLLPFVLVVERSTFLYHYFPAYLFAIALLAWFVDRLISRAVYTGVPRRFIAVVTLGFFALVAVGFLTVLPKSLGL